MSPKNKLNLLGEGMPSTERRIDRGAADVCLIRSWKCWLSPTPPRANEVVIGCTLIEPILLVYGYRRMWAQSQTTMCDDGFPIFDFWVT